MRIGYFDCFCGAAGDMIVGAMLDAGLDLGALSAQLERLGVGGYSLAARKVQRLGMAATKFDVNLEHDHGHDEPDQAEQGHHHHRGLSEILQIIRQAQLPPRASELACRTFTRLGQAEAKVHNVDIEEVHFHEVGAVDSIVDIVAASLGVEMLGIERVVCSPIPTGRGWIKMAHGTWPVPAPATVELLKGATVSNEHFADRETGELTTPTGAALLTALTESYGPLPPMRLEAVGYGAGTREASAGLPNLLRLCIGQGDDAGRADSVMELSANLDDCTGQVIGYALEQLLSAGALDAWASPVTMKKSRPGWMLCALCQVGDAARLEEIFFRQTPTLGVRRRLCARSKLLRRHVTVETRFGPIRIKLGEVSAEGPVLSASPEYADCAAAAEAHGVSLRDVIQEALRVYGRPKP